jgi:DNA-binding MarR family transcriptional regulator
MDEADVERMLDRLAAWGLVEERDGEVEATRRWRALLTAAAEKLNILAAQQGANPEGNPLVLAVSQALANENLDGMTDALFRDAVRVLVVLEVTRMTPEKRAQMGFGEATI